MPISSVSTEQQQGRSGELDVLMGQSIVLGEMKAEILLQNEKIFKSSNSIESNHFHQKAKWVDSVWKQDLCVLLKWHNIS